MINFILGAAVATAIILVNLAGLLYHWHREDKKRNETMDKARQFIKDYTRGCSNELCAVEDIHGKKVISYHEWLTPEQALAAVEIAREELIDKACEWLLKNDSYSKPTDYLVSEFRKVMEK